MTRGIKLKNRLCILDMEANKLFQELTKYQYLFSFVYEFSGIEDFRKGIKKLDSTMDYAKLPLVRYEIYRIPVNGLVLAIGNKQLLCCSMNKSNIEHYIEWQDIYMIEDKINLLIEMEKLILE